MKQNIISILTLTAALSGLTACSEQIEMPSENGTDRTVRLTASSNIALTRAADGLLNVFAGGERVKVAMQDNDVPSTPATTAIYSLGAPVGGYSALTPVADQLFYPNTSAVTLYAVYPTGSMENHTVAHDQRGGDAYKQSDLLYARTIVTSSQMKASNNLEFSHQMVKLRVNITNPDGLSITGVRINKVKRKVTYASTMGTASLTITPSEATDGGGNTITFGPASASTDGSQTYTCVFPAQEWNSTTNEALARENTRAFAIGAGHASFITISTDKGDVTYTLNTDESVNKFIKGKAYTLSITINNLSIGQTIPLSGWPDSNNTITPETSERLSIASIPMQNYTGSAIEPTATVTNHNSEVLTLGTHYTLAYYNNIEEGTALVIATGKGERYEGLTAITTFTIIPKYAIKSKFSVSSTEQVYFSKGNLQYVGVDTWKFADNQWDHFDNTQSDNHRDLFGWGTGNAPNKTVEDDSQYTWNEWGENADLQSTLGSGWYTLSKTEWQYLFLTRSSGSTVNGTSNARYTQAVINTNGTSEQGIILFPDGITIGNSEATSWGAINAVSDWGTKCTTAQWAALADKGCVFLPKSGYRDGSASVTDYAICGHYHTSTEYNGSLMWRIRFASYSLSPADNDQVSIPTHKYTGRAVRLVSKVK